MTICQARSDVTGQMRCARCQIAWDRDDPMVCPQEVPLQATRAHDEDVERSNRFVSGLAPDLFPRR